MRRPAGMADPEKKMSTYSVSTVDDFKLSESRRSSTTSHLSSHPEPPPPPKPSLRLLFSLLPTRNVVLLLTPALFASFIAGGTAPLMTRVIGQNFDAFAAYALLSDPSRAAKLALLNSIGVVALQLVGLAVITLALSGITSCLWISLGEYNVMILRKMVYDAVTRKDMVWFDMKMGTDADVQRADKDAPLGAGGLMAKFARETDDVRSACALATGFLVQYMTTTIACLVLAFVRSPLLTVVILSTIPVLIFVQGLSQRFATPLQGRERQQTAVAATIVDRAINAISTVKAFNAQEHELAGATRAFRGVRATMRRLTAVWGAANGTMQFVMMGMFVQAFWFGAQLVRTGRVSPGDVMAVFWACLIATSHLQMCIPQFIVINKGTSAMAALLSLCQSTSQAPATLTQSNSLFKLRHRATYADLRKIRPRTCLGEVSLHGVTFAYPSRASAPVLRGVSLYFPAGETTFIVGGSGSGKSTVAALLLRLYAPNRGRICIDDRDTAYLDEAWLKEHVAAVSQECTLFEGSVRENVAMGRWSGDGVDAHAEEVERACRTALVHEFVRDLPEGYETRLGNGGAQLSGGQRQRLAIARAVLRDPAILILDEATSALDATSRLLVFEALKHSRRNKTTVVITHDLSQITASDFVYVLKDGEIVEQGYRADLETGTGAFGEMVREQGTMGGFLPEKVIEAAVEDVVGEALEEVLEEQERERAETPGPGAGMFIRPMSPTSGWMFEAIARLTGPSGGVTDSVWPGRLEAGGGPVPGHGFSRQEESLGQGQLVVQRRPSSVFVTLPEPAHVLPTSAEAMGTPTSMRRFSLPCEPSSPFAHAHALGWEVVAVPFTSPFGSSRDTLVKEDDDDVLVKEDDDDVLVKEDDDDVLVKEDVAFEDEKWNLTRSGNLATEVRGAKKMRMRWDEARAVTIASAGAKSKTEGGDAPADGDNNKKGDAPISFWRLMWEVYPGVPHKPLVALGLVVCVLSGTMTPLFSFLLSRLLFEVSIGATHTKVINMFGVAVLGTAAADGLFLGLKYFIMETGAMAWVTRLRERAFARVLAQDKRWFDETAHAAPSLVQLLVKDGDDARSLIGVVVGQCVMVMTMLGVGLVWALVRGWQLTLAGLAVAPVFAVVMAGLTGLAGRTQARNKQARMDVVKGYYEIISNIRGIRAMGLERVFDAQFEAANDRALRQGIRGALFEGSAFGVTNALIFLAEALLFYVGAVLIVKGSYTYLQMVEVLNLVVFTVTIGSQLMVFTEKIAKSVLATRELHALTKLSEDTEESRGSLRPPLNGTVTFNDVCFAYPQRPEVPVLKNVSLSIAEGECVAIVGASGSGKSTVAAMLQRLYEPASGTVTVGGTDTREMDVRYLRENVAVVSQNPHLFDATITENILYGRVEREKAEDVAGVVQRAAEAANVHEFVMGLPRGYDTLVGENAALISGGQAQRLQIARALAREGRILVLDECTSALDGANEAAVMETIGRAKGGQNTTVVVTHKLAVMRLCDRIVVVSGGAVVEEGAYDALVEREGGVFAALARAGEWSLD